MDKTHWFNRIGMAGIVLILVLSLLAIALPQSAQAASDDKLPNNATYTVYIRNGRVFITTAGFPEKTKFKVRVKDASKSQPKFFNLGWVVTPKKDSLLTAFTLPKAIKSALWLDICLKSQQNDKLFCRKVFNPGT